MEASVDGDNGAVSQSSRSKEYNSCTVEVRRQTAENKIDAFENQKTLFVAVSLSQGLGSLVRRLLFYWFAKQ